MCASTHTCTCVSGQTWVTILFLLKLDRRINFQLAIQVSLHLPGQEDIFPGVQAAVWPAVHTPVWSPVQTDGILASCPYSCPVPCADRWKFGQLSILLSVPLPRQHDLQPIWVFSVRSDNAKCRIFLKELVGLWDVLSVCLMLAGVVIVIEPWQTQVSLTLYSTVQHGLTLNLTPRAWLLATTHISLSPPSSSSVAQLYTAKPTSSSG